MKLEEIIEKLNKAYRPIDNEDPDYEQAYNNNVYSAIKEGIKVGKIDPEMLSEEMLMDFMQDGIDYNAYKDAVNEQLVARGENVEEYWQKREEIVRKIDEEKTEAIRSSREEERIKEEARMVKRVIEAKARQVLAEYGVKEGEVEYEEYFNDNCQTLMEMYEKGELVILDGELVEPEEEYEESYGPTEEEYEESCGPTKEEVNSILKEAGEKALLPENANVKHNWMSKIKDWLKDKVKSIKDRFDR